MKSWMVAVISAIIGAVAAVAVYQFVLIPKVQTQVKSNYAACAAGAKRTGIVCQGMIDTQRFEECLNIKTEQ